MIVVNVSVFPLSMIFLVYDAWALNVFLSHLLDMAVPF
jgi:hypothetical protein